MNPWPSHVAVATPTVARRAAPLTVTLDQWAALGTRPHLHTQPPDWPLSHTSHRRTVHTLLRTVLDTRPDATHLLLAEDDIDIDPALPHLLPGLCDTRIITLFVNGLRFYPPPVTRAITDGRPIPRHVAPIRQQHAWWGSQAVILPRPAAEAALRHDSPRAGWDIHLRDWAQTTRTRIHVAIPNLVQHRGVPSLASTAGGGLGRSATWRWPTPDTPETP